MLAPARDRSQRLSPGHLFFLVVALLWHVSLHLVPCDAFYSRLTFDSTATGGRRAWDFYALYQGGHNLRTGVSIYESDDDKIDVVVLRHTPYRYLPFPAFTVGVLANALPPVTAYWVWVAIIELLLLICAICSWRLARSPDRGAVLAGMWLLFTPIYLELYLGQFTLVQAALVLGMLVSSQSGLNRRSDLWWAVSLLWKQNTALLIPVYLRHRRWLPLAVILLVVLALSLPYLLIIPGALHSFGRNFVTGEPGHQLGNLGVRQWLFSLTSWLWPQLGIAGHQWIDRLWLLLVLVLGGGATFLTPKTSPASLICLWMTAYFLVYHDVWEHHYVLALPICVWLYRESGSRWVLLCYALLAVWTPYLLVDPQGLAAHDASMRWLPLTPRWMDVAYHSCKALPIMGLWGWQLGQLWGANRTCSPT